MIENNLEQCVYNVEQLLHLDYPFIKRPKKIIISACDGVRCGVIQLTIRDNKVYYEALRPLKGVDCD